ncbi:COX assembly mitochondrial protein 2 homolog isoform X1 [Hylobates moloch]|uniref:COX assembly mitochondrial protein 2 homolog isoform X1 n=1 Tax=Hylobates moloch TaxID=81572 RepID=UPI00136443CF|nr:COX assembly mitochondrial protein 2 homolog isoform X1 [Hylobates moloch]
MTDFQSYNHLLSLLRTVSKVSSSLLSCGTFKHQRHASNLSGSVFLSCMWPLVLQLHGICVVSSPLPPPPPLSPNTARNGRRLVTMAAETCSAALKPGPTHSRAGPEEAEDDDDDEDEDEEDDEEAAEAAAAPPGTPAPLLPAFAAAATAGWGRGAPRGRHHRLRAPGEAAGPGRVAAGRSLGTGAARCRRPRWSRVGQGSATDSCAPCSPREVLFGNSLYCSCNFSSSLKLTNVFKDICCHQEIFYLTDLSEDLHFLSVKLSPGV